MVKYVRADGNEQKSSTLGTLNDFDKSEFPEIADVDFIAKYYIWCDRNGISEYDKYRPTTMLDFAADMEEEYYGSNPLSRPAGVWKVIQDEVKGLLGVYSVLFTDGETTEVSARDIRRAWDSAKKELEIFKRWSPGVEIEDVVEVQPPKVSF